MTDDRVILTQHIGAIDALDEIERDCKARALDWVAQERQVYRLQKPDVPKKHLVAYFVAIDPATQNVLLVHHNLAKAWLPTGGHIEPQENPLDTIRRECREELGVDAIMLRDDKPLFISEAHVTDGDLVHTDLNLWYLVRLDEQTPLQVEEGVFGEVKWWSVPDLIETPARELGPDLSRFVRKLRYLLHQGLLAL